jgi:phage terminase large subunit-like protein
MLKPLDYVNKHLQKLEEYISGITGNTLVANKFEKLAVQRFIVHKSKYIYREDQVRRVLKFFCLLNIPHKNSIKQFELLGYQVFWIASIFGLYWDQDNRLYSQSFILTAKKSGKSTFTAGLVLYSCIGDNVLNSHSLIVASSRDQARILLDYVKFIIKNSAALTDLFTTNKNIIYNRNGSTTNKIEIRASEAGKINGLGAGVALSVVDEFAFHPDASLQQSIKSGQITQTNHHQIIISTASSDLNSPGFVFYESAVNVLEGIVSNDDLFTCIYTVDDRSEIYQPELYRKANPSIGHTFTAEALEKEVLSTKAFPQNLEKVLTHHFNVWCNLTTENFISDDLVVAQMKEDRQIKPGSTVFLGGDFSSLNDLSALCVLCYDQTEDIFIAKLIHIFPNNEKNKIKKGSIDLQRWINEGHILRCDMKSLDENLVIEQLQQLNDTYNINSFGFDPWNARILMNRVKDELRINCDEVLQNYTLSYPIKVVEKYLENGKLFLDRSPVTRWQFRNLRVKTDGKNNYRIEKNKGESVDGIVALSVAMSQWLEHNYENPNVVLDDLLRDIRSKREVEMKKAS